MHNRHVMRVALTGCAFALSAPSTVRADWPNFRGPNHDGISTETGLKTASSEPLRMVWDREIGSGFSSFAAVGDRIFTAGTANNRQVIYCLNAATGAELWQHDLEPEYKEASGGDGPRATPTIDDNRLYFLGAKGTLVCLHAQTGKLIWKHKFSNEPQWGYSGSVLIERNLAVASAGESDGALVAFDKRTGTPVWKTGDDPVGYATPYPFTLEGTRYITGFTGVSAMIVEAATGRLVWRVPWKTDWNVNAAAPIFHDGHLFLSSGYTTGCALLSLRKSGDVIEADEVWRSRVLINKFQSCLLHEGHLYASDQKALVCVDFATGKELWRRHRVKHGTLLLADKNLILFTQQGRLQIAPISPEAFSPTLDAELLSGRCWTVPTLHRQLLYVRNLTRVACFDLRQ